MTVKEYNEWRKEFGRVQVLLYAFPNVLKKIGNEDLIKELKMSILLTFLIQPWMLLRKLKRKNL